MRQEQEQVTQRAKVGGTFAAYFALGDSISIGTYPEYDALDRRDLMIPKPIQLGVYSELGAPSILFRTLLDAGVISEPSEMQILATDGATTADLMGQVRKMDVSRLHPKDHVLVTMTIGGNDLLVANAAHLNMGDMYRVLERGYDHVARAIEALAGKLHEQRVTLLLTNVYDPSDGSGLLRMFGAKISLSEMLGVLAEWNKLMGEVPRAPELEYATSDNLDIVLVDLHSAFKGHGARVAGPMLDQTQSPDFYYWGRSWIEPGVYGARALAELWEIHARVALTKPGATKTDQALREFFQHPPSVVRLSCSAPNLAAEPRGIEPDDDGGRP